MVLIMASGDEIKQEPKEDVYGFTEIKSQTTKRGRKPRQPKIPKKQTQRGLGVAQLERLRIQERWKKMTEPTDPKLLPQSVNIQTQYQIPYFTSPVNYGTSMITSGVHQVGLIPAQSFGGGARFHGFGGLGSGGGGFGVGVGGFLSDQVQVDHRVGFWINGCNVFETSTELSSIQKMQPMSKCNVCPKKKRISGESSRIKGVRNKLVERPLMDGCDSIGLNHGNNHKLKGKMRDLTAGHGDCAGGNEVEGVEVMAVHTVGGGGSYLMEYDFFSEKEKGEVARINTSTGVGGEVNSTCVDLSLKL